MMCCVLYFVALWTVFLMTNGQNRDFAYPLDIRGSQEDYPRFHYTPEEDPYYRGNGGDFPEYTRTHLKNTSSQIPLDFARKINQYSVNDLLLNFVDGDVEDEPTLQDRFGAVDGHERSATAIRPKAATCMPEVTTIRIVENNDPQTFYIPQCTRIERCGGCCGHPLLKCQPEQKESINFKVMKTQFTGAQKLKLVAKEIVTVEKHTKCKCDCRIQPEDCKPFQQYQKNECKCICTNVDEEKKCAKTNDKLWNPDLCTCQCRQITACTTGSTFDLNECKCKPMPMKRRFADYEKPGAPADVEFDQDY